MDAVEGKVSQAVSSVGKGVWILLILLAGGLVYANSLQGRFLYDDYISIVENPRIRDLCSSIQQSSRPLTHLSFALQFHFSGLRVEDFHLLNNGLHLANGILLFLLMDFLLKRRINSTEHNGRLAGCVAGCIAILWVVHPIQTESVTYIAQRAELMTGFFCLATLFIAISRVFYNPCRNGVVMCVICCALGMLSKPVMVIVPVLVLVSDRLFFQSSVLDALRARKGFYSFLFLTMFIPVVLWLLPNESSSSSGAETGISSSAYFMTQPGVILHYLRLSVWPVPLCLDYGWPVAANLRGEVVDVAIISVILAVIGWIARRNTIAIFGLLWFLITLLPSSSVFPLSDAAAEHRMYLPLAGLLILLASGVLSIFRWVSFRPAVITVITIMVAGSAVGLGILTRDRNCDYADEARIWTGVVMSRPDNLRGYVGLGAVLAKRGQWQDAHNILRQVANRVPDPQAAQKMKVETDYAIAMRNLGITSFQLGLFAESDVCFSNALAAVSWDKVSRKEMIESRRRIAELLSSGSTAP